MRRFLLVAAIQSCIAFSPLASRAVEGVIELNQACATTTGCLPGDAAGFPIKITHRGSYRLTSNLAIPTQDTNAIEIDSSDVSIDLNGFSLLGTNTVPVPPDGSCSAPGSGRGVVGTSVSGAIAVFNGHIRGMGNGGIYLPASTARVERVILEGNCGAAVEVGTASIVLESQARGNRGNAFQLNYGGHVRDCIAEWNFGLGIDANSASVISGNVASSNSGTGIRLRSAGVMGGMVTGNSTARNGGGGIVVEAAGTVLFNSVAENNGIGMALGATTGAGLNASVANSGVEISGGVTIGCNSTDATKVCP